MYVIFIKRIIDIVLSLISLPFILLIIIIAIFIYFSDRGNPFFCAKRVGQHGIIFTMIKFRTMILDAPDIRLEDGSTYNGVDDPRITKIGGFLRKTSLDEIPQIYNVFIGNMSFIGPRPDPVDWLERYTEDEKVFLKVKPGITGYNQAYFRNRADGAMKLVNDVYYAKNISFKLILKIFFKTLRTVLLRENLYIDDNRKNV